MQVAGNTVYCTAPNGGTGIYAYGNVPVGPGTIGGALYGPNTVYGYTGGTGICVTQGTAATGNIVYGNGTGIQLGYASSAVDNRVYDNSCGILVEGGARSRRIMRFTATAWASRWTTMAALSRTTWSTPTRPQQSW